jgi:Flp pilus assembly pilin Flp
MKITRKGQSVVEYGLILALITIVSATILGELKSLTNTMNKVAGAMTTDGSNYGNNGNHYGQKKHDKRGY